MRSTVAKQLRAQSKSRQEYRQLKKDYNNKDVRDLVIARLKQIPDKYKISIG